ncbi:MAG TPA: hypothetical protein PLL69_02385 [Gemmatimonadales bacterium]|nr:hypothetical protein [Gemmatimonadales bacterium]
MPVAIRRLLVTGIGLTLVGLLGLAAAVSSPGAARPWVRYVFIPSYVVGAVLLLAAGVWWLVRYTRE